MIDKDAVVARIRRTMRATYRGEHIEAACLYWAEAAFWELMARGERPLIQAGTLSWRCAAVDDGVSPLNFSYEWDVAQVPKYLSQGILPEVHVWVALPDRGPEIVDVTTCYLVQQARERAGLVWTAPPPPDYLWTDKAGLPEGVMYRPEPEAIVLALMLLDHPLPAAMVRR